MSSVTEGKIVLESDNVHNRHHESTREWQLAEFAEEFSLDIKRVSSAAMEFDMLNVEAPIANAIRRVLMAEIPTMAIETVFMMNNTSVIHDEVLAHRLGLIPIKVDPTLFQWKGDAEPTDINTIVFRLDVRCERDRETGQMIGDKVYSSDLQWDPKGTQAERFAEVPIRPVHDNILVAKLRPGQEIVVELHCQKGIGRDHTKFSPVATAYYRLMPEIKILQDITGADAVKFAKCFVPGVIKVDKKDGVEKAVVADARRCTMSREALRHKEFQGKVKLMHNPKHFIFNIESTGAMTPPELVLSALKRIIRKCQIVQSALDKLSDGADA